MLYLTREGKAEDMVNTIEQMRKKDSLVVLLYQQLMPPQTVKVSRLISPLMEIYQ